jgi:glutathione synthase/RimK-type ligase-like ATP-grasp enzyme
MQMPALADVAVADCTVPLSERLNRECTCVTLDREALCAAFEREAGDPEFCATLIRTRPHLFASATVFLSEAQVAAMLRAVRAIESVARLSAYRDAVLSRSPGTAQRDFGPRGAFMGYDFHLAHDRPRLIEINTNAGGAFLNALLARAQHACCEAMLTGLGRSEARDFDAAAARMFESEWRLQRRAGTPRRIAIVDDSPEGQYLYPEFLLAQRFFARHGMEAVIADAGQLRFERGELLFDGRTIDLVYNRLVDFALEQPAHAALRAAYLADAVVVTPNPHVHALFADKRNLALLSDPMPLRLGGVSAETLADLSAVPRTVLVSPENAQELWRERKKLFFKPAVGYGSKAVYRGDRMTKHVWGEIQRGHYVAQDYAAPSERVIDVDGAPAVRKTDVRLYVYDGTILLTAARLYQGQATNFRTPGSGFAPVFVI